MRVAIFLMERCFGSGIHSIIDALIAANYSMVKSGLSPLFEWDTVALTEAAVTPTNGLQIKPDYSLAQYQQLPGQADVWIFPAVFHSFSDLARAQKAIQSMQPIVPVIQQHYQQDGLLVSICSGSFLLAEAGLLDNRPALMHWKSEPLFRRMYPRLNIDTEKTVADYGNIVCTIGGGMAYEYLVLHLVERYAGHQAAVNTAKLLMINLNPPSPSPFREALDNRSHPDKLVLQAQRLIEQHSGDDMGFSQLASQLHISERQLNRRFNRALQCSPLQYLQKVRIQHACNLLEASRLPSSKIVYAIGYRDESSFRRLFKKHLGTTMEQYRRQFGREQTAMPEPIPDPGTAAKSTDQSMP
ncbi:MAG: helix-turn-helix domain-containing protein [Gammaproteobacteria bacterium]|nr:helix-turn-helix domain-containing protein [Gammaproteobacteria bacterium]